MNLYLIGANGISKIYQFNFGDKVVPHNMVNLARTEETEKIVFDQKYYTAILSPFFHDSILSLSIINGRYNFIRIFYSEKAKHYKAYKNIKDDIFQGAIKPNPVGVFDDALIFAVSRDMQDFKAELQMNHETKPGMTFRENDGLLVVTYKRDWRSTP